MNYNKVYQKLKKELTDEQIAESMLIPQDMTIEERIQSNKEIRAYRMERLRNMSEEERILSDVMRLKFQIEGYINKETFSDSKTFGKFLEEYIRILKKSRREIADDLSIHYTKLSRIVNDKEEPNVELSYRLEKHSGNLINAKLWWKLIIKKQEYIISVDKKTRKSEQKKVKNYLKAS